MVPNLGWGPHRGLKSLIYKYEERVYIHTLLSKFLTNMAASEEGKAVLYARFD